MKAKNRQLKQLLANFLLCFECKCMSFVSARDFLVSDDKFPTCLDVVLIGYTDTWLRSKLN